MLFGKLNRPGVFNDLFLFYLCLTMTTQSILSFITFSGFTDLNKVELLFKSHHDQWKSKYGYWTMQSTAKRLEGDYWNLLVPIHFVCVSIILFLIALSIPTHWLFWQTLVGFCLIDFLLFITFKNILYKPRFELHFIPLLNNAVQHLGGEAKDAISKAKSGQYKSFTLLLIQSVLQKLSGCSKISDGNIQRELLCRQYGISNDSLDAPLKNLLSKPYNDQETKMKTMMQDYFDEARNYFELLNNNPAIALLHEIEQCLQNGKKLPL
jgi:hypothetical protein